MEWQQILGFYHVAKLGSFTKAAEATFRTQPALSQQIKHLEDELECRLLERSEKYGDGIMATYPTSVNGIDELKDVFKEQSYPAAEQLPHQLLTLPIHPYVDSTDRRRISQYLSKIPRI